MKVTFNPESLLTVLNSTEKSAGAAFTIKSQETGTEYTYKLRRQLGRVHYTAVYVETGYMNFRFLGVYRDGSLWNKGKKVETPSAIAIAWTLKHIECKHDLSKRVEFFHLGFCLKCGRTLTDSTSISIGLGPKCRS